MTKEQKHKNTVMFIFAGVVVSVILLIVITMSKEKQPENFIAGNEENPRSEEQDLLRENAEAIKMAMDNSNYKPVAVINKNDHLRGDTSAPAHIILYSDYSSKIGYGFYQTMEQIRQEFGDSVVIAYRHFPLPDNNGNLLASLAVECGHEQDKFFEMQEAVLAGFADRKSFFGRKEIISKAEELEMDAEKFASCLDSQSYKHVVQRDIDGAYAAGVLGAPTIFINGASYAGAIPFDDFTDSSGEERRGMKTLVGHHLEIMDNYKAKKENLAE